MLNEVKEFATNLWDKRADAEADDRSGLVQIIDPIESDCGDPAAVRGFSGQRDIDKQFPRGYLRGFAAGYKRQALAISDPFKCHLFLAKTWGKCYTIRKVVGRGASLPVPSIEKPKYH